MLNEPAEAAQTAAPPVGAGEKGAMPAEGRTRMATETGGFANRSSTKPAASASEKIPKPPLITVLSPLPGDQLNPTRGDQLSASTPGKAGCCP